MNAATQARLQKSLRSTFLGIAVNILLAAGKTTAGIVGHSHALIADGVESFADIISSLIVWRGLVVAAAPADEEHPYGHGKAEPIAAALVGLMLVGAAIWIAVQSVHEIITPHQAPRPYTLVVLIAVVAIKELLFRRVLHTAGEVASSAVESDAWHHRSDAITSIAAGLGITIALIGGKGYEWADDGAAMLASLLIAWNGWTIIRNALDELMDAAPSGEIVAEVRRVAAAVPKVEFVEKCIIRRHGYHLWVDLHVQVDPQMTVAESHRIAHEVKDRLRQEMPRVSDVLIHIEPCAKGAR